MAFVRDKVALVTGGASGIGYAITENLLKNAAKGVVIADFSADGGKQAAAALSKSFGDRVVFVKTDVTNAEELEAAFRKVIEIFSQLDIVVNNAGILNEIDWERTIRINLDGVMRGTYLAMDTYLPKYRSTKDAAIINIASVLGIGAVGCLPAYTASKHGVVGFGKSISMDSTHKNANIRVITICPNVVNTPLLDPEKALTNVENPKRVLNDLATLYKIPCSADYIGKSIVSILSKGENGSVWVLENEADPYEIQFSPRIEMAKTS